MDIHSPRDRLKVGVSEWSSLDFPKSYRNNRLKEVSEKQNILSFDNVISIST